MRDHAPLVVDNFRGTFDRGEDESCPAGFLLSSINLDFIKNGIQTRDGMLADALAAGILPTIKVKRMELYERIGEAQRLLILDDAGHIWDSVTGIIILSIPTMIDFGCTVMFDRAYITPHNGLTGLPGEKVYLYEGSGTARPAAGVGPSISPGITVVDSALSGKVEQGLHAFGVAFESSSGYISTIGAFQSYTSAGEHKLDISNIPLGPAGTVARLIGSTKTLEILGPFDTQTYYLVPGGRIPNNTATTATVDYFDSDLMEDGSYLLEQLDEIPAGVGIGQYKGRLAVWGEDANSAVIRLSQPGQPENHNGADGYLTVYPGIGGGVKNCAEYRNQLVILKSHRTYSSQDNDDVPATWDIGEVDGSIGTECHGIGQILNVGSNVEDRLFIADRSGLRLFTGTFSDENIITFNIDDIWSRITKTSFNNVEVSIDASNCRIYAAVPLDGSTTASNVLFGDYSEGLTEDSIKWTMWSFTSKRPTSIVLSLIAGQPVFKYGSIDGYVYKQDPDALLDNGQVIGVSVKFPLYPVGTVDEQINHYTGIRARMRGVGQVDIYLEGLDAVNSRQAASLVLVEKPGFPYFRGFDFTSEHCSVTLIMNQPNSWMILTKFILYLTPVWESRANVS